MPGIYVRKASWINWSHKGDNPTLIVPGSYWLCYKNNIYKFILRYHRNTKCSKQFNYAKELMKVIRKIIKSEPPQGQQFCTSHLLVTFNRTSWTRQDKIFALMKFKERSVTAFSHAFILNIKLCDTLERKQSLAYAKSSTSGQSLTYKTGSSNSATDYKNESEKYFTYSSARDFSERNDRCDAIREAALTLENGNIYSYGSTTNNNLANSISVKSKTVKQPINRGDDTFSKDSNVCLKVLPTFESTIKPSVEVSKDNGTYLNEDNNKKDSKLSSDEKPLNKHSAGKDSIRYENDPVPNNSGLSNNSCAIDDTSVDINLPYQYLIEKEIENSEQNVKKRTLEEADEKYSLSDVEENSETQDLPARKRRKYDSDNVQRSSDITDLVMEGLMFTIRQEQDTVAVIEQKTKLEIDEVLENSEKIETEEGEKCLRNSSLLGLENLITMIELPKEAESKNKYQSIADQESAVKNQSTNERLFSDAKYPLTYNIVKQQSIAPELKRIQLQSSDKSVLADTSIVNERCLEKYDNRNCNENGKLVENRNVIYKKDERKWEKEKTEASRGIEEREEEDIVPEALQNEVFQPTIFTDNRVAKSQDNINFVPNKDLLTDRVNVTESLQLKIDKNKLIPCFGNEDLEPKPYWETCKIPVNSVTNKAQIPRNTISESKCNDKRRKTCTPMIISNQIISLNEIPLPLQKILRNKLSVKRISVNNENKVDNDSNEIRKIQQRRKDDDTSVKRTESEIGGSDIQTSQRSEYREKSVHGNDEIHAESAASAPLRIEAKDAGTSEEDTKLKEEKLREENAKLKEEKLREENTKLKEEKLQEQNVKLKEEKLKEENSCSTDKVKEDLPPNKIQDITKEFYQDFPCLQKKNNVIDQKYLGSRRKSLKMLNDANSDDIHIQMVKFFQDITRGAKVVVRRISVNKYS